MNNPIQSKHTVNKSIGKFKCGTYSLLPPGIGLVLKQDRLDVVTQLAQEGAANALSCSHLRGILPLRCCFSREQLCCLFYWNLRVLPEYLMFYICISLFNCPCFSVVSFSSILVYFTCFHYIDYSDLQNSYGHLFKSKFMILSHR